MGKFWVVGTEYEDTHFQETVGSNEEWIGPFSDYESARQEWAKHAWHTVDEATVRYRIECIDQEQPPICTD